MSDAFEIRFKGQDALEKELQKIADEFLDVAASALRVEAEVEMTEAKERTPVRFGHLKASGLVTTNPDRLSVTLSFGNSAVDYALIVHEDEEMLHRVGQAKFLESVLEESAPYMADRVAKTMRKLQRF